MSGVAMDRVDYIQKTDMVISVNGGKVRIVTNLKLDVCFSGELRNNATVFNASRQMSESGIKVFIPHSDQLQDVEKVTAGNIAVLSGLKGTVTGDTLVKSESSAKKAAKRHHASKHDRLNPSADVALADDFDDMTVEAEGEGRSTEGGSTAVGLVLAGIDPPEPVFFCSIEPPSLAELHPFERALNELLVEDPSLRMRVDKERQQTILEGMGELHIEIVKDRLLREYGINAFLGPLQIAYRERIESAVRHAHTLVDTINDLTMNIRLDFSIAPNPGSGPLKQVQIDLEDENAPFIRRGWFAAIKEGCENAMLNGPVLGFPVQDVSVTLRAIVASGGKVNPALISACANICLTDAMKLANAHILEPIMRIEVTVLGDSAEIATQGVTKELGRRRAEVLAVDGDGMTFSAVHARAPLADLIGFASAVRAATSGLGSLHMELDGYHRMTPEEQSHLVQRVKAGHVV
uniref:Elongation factor G n=1 Tax=Plectus sambesii TaxID=2011161 RepID=A0A914X8F0_9BILA